MVGVSLEESGGEDDVGGRVESKGFRCEWSTVLDDENDGRDVVESGDGSGAFALVRYRGRKELVWTGGGDEDGGIGGEDASFSNNGRRRSDRS